jgi:hypothetical protein
VEEKLNCTIERLEKKLQNEQKARKYAVNIMADQIRSLQENLEKAQNDSKVAKERQKKAENDIKVAKERLKKAEYDRKVAQEENEKLKERCIIL